MRSIVTVVVFLAAQRRHSLAVGANPRKREPQSLIRFRSGRFAAAAKTVMDGWERERRAHARR